MQGTGEEYEDIDPEFLIVVAKINVIMHYIITMS